MSYNAELAARVRTAVARRKGFTAKAMFGGVGFLLNGNLCVAVWKDFLILRLGIDPAEAALRQPFVKAFDVTGKAMKGWVMVELQGVEDDADLQEWMQQSVKFVKTLPSK